MTGEENFWPSFTDVMMVVVIVFLLASTAVVLHNWDLVNQVRAVMMLEQEARQEAEGLDAQQKLLQEELRHARGRIAQASSELIRKEQELSETSQELVGVRDHVSELEAMLLSLQNVRRRLQAKLETAQEEQIQQEADLLSVQQQLEQMRREKTGFEQRYIAVDAQQRQTQAELEDLRTQYANVEKKYLALVKPARSALGKTVVLVRYSKQDGQSVVALKFPDAQTYQPMSEEDLHAQLTTLKEEHGNNLFLRVIIPENSGLSYDEGWRFSLGLLKRYDYYYQ